MRGKPLRRAINAFSAIALLFAQFLLPANVVLAEATTGPTPTVTTTDTKGTLQRVWCQVVGYGWTAQLGGDNVNRSPLTQLPAGSGSDLQIIDGQVYAPNSKDPVLKGMLDTQCGIEYTITTPLQVEVCGPNNDTITAGAHMTISADTMWVNNSRTITFTATEPYTFTVNNKSVSTATVTYTDANVSCGPTVITAVPTVTTADVCGPNNDTITSVSTSAYYTQTSDTGWVNGARTYVFTANEGYVFTGNANTYSVTVHDVNTPCKTLIDMPKVNQKDICGDNNDTLKVHEGNYTVTGDTGWVDNERTLTFTASEGYTFESGVTTTLTFTDEATPCRMLNPQVTQTTVCGPNNDGVIISEGKYSIQSDTGWVNNQREIVLVADHGYRFDKGEGGKTFEINLTDSNTPCVVSYTLPTVVNQCGVVNDSVTLPKDTTQVHYTLSVFNPVTNGYTFTAKAQTGFVFSDGTDTYTKFISMSDAGLNCPLGMGGLGEVTPPTVTVTAATPVVATTAEAPAVSELPHTGPTTNNALTVLGLVASVVTYGAVLGLQRRNGTL